MVNGGPYKMSYEWKRVTQSKAAIYWHNALGWRLPERLRGLRPSQNEQKHTNHNTASPHHQWCNNSINALYIPNTQVPAKGRCCRHRLKLQNCSSRTSALFSCPFSVWQQRNWWDYFIAQCSILYKIFALLCCAFWRGAVCIWHSVYYHGTTV